MCNLPNYDTKILHAAADLDSITSQTFAQQSFQWDQPGGMLLLSLPAAPQPTCL